MESEDILRNLSENHLNLILGGGIVCFISLFLPFYQIDAVFSYSGVAFGPNQSLYSTWLFWIYIIVIGGIYYGYYQKYGEKYPYLFLTAGGLLVFMTLYATQLYSGGNNLISILYGFFCEFIGSLAVAVGGYYYYLQHNTPVQA